MSGSASVLKPDADIPSYETLIEQDRARGRAVSVLLAVLCRHEKQ